MANKETLFVLGAGASAEVGMPTGEELKGSISEALDFSYDHRGAIIGKGDDRIRQALILKKQAKYNEDLRSCIEACHRVRRAMPLAPSIDSFVDSQRGDVDVELCAKLAIACVIGEREARCRLWKRRRGRREEIDFDGLKETWYIPFFRWLTRGLPFDQLEDRLARVAVIDFNYDRILELFLNEALRAHYGVSPETALSLLKGLEVYRPYGYLGSPFDQAEGTVSFGDAATPQHLLEASKRLRTFTQGTSLGVPELERMRRRMLDSDSVVFLGFGFHDMNMKLLRVGAPLHPGNPPGRVCHGTAVGVSASNVERIKQGLAEWLVPSQSRVSLRTDVPCSNLIDEYGLSL